MALETQSTFLLPRDATNRLISIRSGTHHHRQRRRVIYILRTHHTGLHCGIRSHSKAHDLEQVVKGEGACEFLHPASAALFPCPGHAAFEDDGARGGVGLKSAVMHTCSRPVRREEVEVRPDRVRPAQQR